MIITIQKRHSLGELFNTGCKVYYWLEKHNFPMGEIKPPQEIHLLPLPKEWDIDKFGWAPEGYEALHLSALIGIGIEYPELQKKMLITATGAVIVPCKLSFPKYLFLGVDRDGARMIDDTNGMLAPFCLRNHEKFGFKVVAAFRKLEFDPCI